MSVYLHSGVYVRANLNWLREKTRADSLISCCFFFAVILYFGICRRFSTKIQMYKLFRSKIWHPHHSYDVFTVIMSAFHMHVSNVIRMILVLFASQMTERICSLILIVRKRRKFYHIACRRLESQSKFHFFVCRSHISFVWLIADRSALLPTYSEQILAEQKLAQDKVNPSQFGVLCERNCICMVPGQLPCPGVVRLPNHMRGKFKFSKNWTIS